MRYLKKTINKRSPFIKTLIMIERLRQNSQAKAPLLILRDLARVTRYHIKRLSPQEKEDLKRFSFWLYFENNDFRNDENFEGRDITEVKEGGYYVAVSALEYSIEKKVRFALAMLRLKRSGFIDLVRKVSDGGRAR